MFARLAYSALAALALGSVSFAQCAEWDQRFSLPLPGINGPVACLAVFDDGSGPGLFAGGVFTSAGAVPASNIAKWNGVSWSALGSGVNNPVNFLAVFDDGSGSALYAGGDFTSAGGVSASRIAKWNGTSWSALGPPGGGINGWVSSLAVFDDGSGPALFAGGDFTSAGGVAANRIAKWNGSSWSTLGTPGSNGLNGTVVPAVYSLAIFDDGSGPELFVGGSFMSAGGVLANNVAKWNGTSWSALGVPGSGMDSWVYSLAVFDDGSGPGLFAGGRFTLAGGVSASRIAKWNGTSWSALGAGMNNFVLSLGVFDDGSGRALVAGGYFTSAGGVSALHIAKWNGASWSAMGAPGSGMDSWVYSLAVFDDGSGPALFAGGAFTAAGGIPASRIAKWSSSSWTALGTPGAGMNGLVRSLAVFDDGSGPSLFACGDFTSAGGVPTGNAAEWNGASWSALGAPGSGINGLVSSFAVFDEGSGPALIVGGDFTSAGGVPASFIAKWNGSSWSSLGAPGSGVNGPVSIFAVYDDGSGPALFVCGSFTSAGGVPANHIAKWNGTSWSALGSGVTSPITLVGFDDGSGPALFMGGFFGSAGGVPASSIAKWNGTSWSALGAPGSGMNNSVWSLGVFDEGSGPALFAGGLFTLAGGVSASHIARWNGTSWSALGAPGSGMNGTVRSLVVFDDGSGPALFAGGGFTSAGGVPANYVAKWNGTSWSALGTPGTGANELILSLAVFDDGSDGDADLYLGGIFTAAGGFASVYIAEWHGCSSQPVPFCFGAGSAPTCPCANQGLAGHGCDNSIASGGAVLTAAGMTSPDTMVLTQSDELPSSLSLFLQGSVDLATPAVFGDGLRCIGGALKRLYLKSAISGTASAPLAGDPSITTQSALLGDPISPGSARSYQVYYRDPSLTFCPSPQGDGFNVGNALRVVW